MILSHFVASSIVGGVVASTTVIRMPRNTYSFPIEYIPVDGNRALVGTASLDIFGEVSSRRFRYPLDYRTDDEYQLIDPVDSIQARGLSIGNNAVTIDFDSPLEVRSGDRAFVQVGPDSQFAHNIPDSILSPFSEMEHELVLNPSDPTEYAYEGRFLYTSLNSGNRLYPLSGSIRMTSVEDGSERSMTDFDNIFFSLSISEPSTMGLPFRLCRDLITRIDSMGIQTSREGVRYTLHDVTPDQLEMFPSIEILMQGEDGSANIQIGQLEPIDYLVPTDEPNRFKITELIGNRFRLPRRIIDKLVIHFDFENNRIGFADPLVEL